MEKKELNQYPTSRDQTKSEKIKYGCLLTLTLLAGSTVGGLIYVGEKISKLKQK